MEQVRETRREPQRRDGRHGIDGPDCCRKQVTTMKHESCPVTTINRESCEVTTMRRESCATV